MLMITFMMAIAIFTISTSRSVLRTYGTALQDFLAQSEDCLYYFLRFQTFG